MTNGAPSAEEIGARAMRLFQGGQHAEALEQFQAAERAYRALGDAGMASEMLNNQGVVHRLRRDWPAAAAALRAAIDGFAAIPDSAREGQTTANLGDVYAAQRDRAAAEKCYGRAAELLAEAGDADKQARVLRAMSLDQLRRGHFWAAMMLMERSLTVRHRPGPLGWLFRNLLRFALSLLTGR